MEVMKDLVYPWLFAPHIHDQVEEDDDINIKPASHNAYKDDLAHKSEDLNGEFTVALMHYQKPGVHPPGARVEAKPMKLATVKPIPLWQMWKYGLAAATKSACSVITLDTGDTDVNFNHLFSDPSHLRRAVPSYLGTSQTFVGH